MVRRRRRDIFQFQHSLSAVHVIVFFICLLSGLCLIGWEAVFEFP